MRNSLTLLARVNWCNHFGKNWGTSSKDENEHIQQNHVCVSMLEKFLYIVAGPYAKRCLLYLCF